ncbi:nascent polypeptide-associated complex subunit alpha, muscle-specific form-like [Spodoptera frugiperda]|uniref:Nascent polypeptide-associated complex subunit alpha, muscle-specific form-like n=1 Tax=Spodoptera frugiperda TaxID=7108 RepID=A0A9R0EYA8_SPOFR|nr:nascent polypeptide-associated complex subunit alpha, muscle-specific form-like [Spodoptera frugiperda]
MPHGGREQSPRSSKLGPAGRGRVFKNSRLRPTETRTLHVAIQGFVASATPTPSATGGAGEEFFPPPPSIPDTPASPSPPLRTAPPAWPTAALEQEPEPMDVVPTTATPDAGVTHPPSAIPRPTPRPNSDAAQPAATATAAPRATAPRAPAPALAAGQKPRKPQPAAAPPRPQRPPKKPTAMAPAAPMRPAPPSAAPPRAAPMYRAPPVNIAPGRFPSPPKMPADKRKAVFITPPFRPPPILPPFAPPLHGAAPVATYAAAAAATTTGTPAPAAPPTPKPRSPTTPCAPPPKKTRYPPLIVEKLPNWVEHFTALKRRLGHAPNARPFGKGVRFTPRSDEEYRAIQAYLAELEKSRGVAWFSYSLPAERSVKVAIRGLPVDTPPEAIMEALQDAGYGAEYVRPIRARQGRPGCLYYAQVARADNTIPGIYGVTELLCMPGIKIEAWRGRKGPAQCHRCQQFRHSSHNCHRPMACVRCGEEHPASECPRPKEEPPTCANCGGAHTANNTSCPVFRRETRNPRAGTVARTAAAPTAKPAAAQPRGENNAPGSLMAAANEPGGERRKRRRRKKAPPPTAAAPKPAAAPPAPPAPPLPPLLLLPPAPPAPPLPPLPLPPPLPPLRARRGARLRHGRQHSRPLRSPPAHSPSTTSSGSCRRS